MPRSTASGVRRQASGVRRQASGVRRQASGGGRQAAGGGRRSKRAILFCDSADGSSRPERPIAELGDGESHIKTRGTNRRSGLESTNRCLEAVSRAAKVAAGLLQNRLGTVKAQTLSAGPMAQGAARGKRAGVTSKTRGTNRRSCLESTNRCFGAVARAAGGCVGGWLIGRPWMKRPDPDTGQWPSISGRRKKDLVTSKTRGTNRRSCLESMNRLSGA